MSNTARKARKRAGVKFEKAQKVGTIRVAEVVPAVEYISEVAPKVAVPAPALSATEFATVERFGLDKPDGKLALDHLAFGFALVVLGVVVLLVGAAVVVWAVLS